MTFSSNVHNTNMIAFYRDELARIETKYKKDKADAERMLRAHSIGSTTLAAEKWVAEHNSLHSRLSRLFLGLRVRYQLRQILRQIKSEVKPSGEITNQ